MSQSAVVAQGIAHRYGKQQALDNVSFTLVQGERCGLIGPDGAGKSSLLGLISGVKIVQQGELDVLGGAITARKHRKTLYQRIAFMPQGLGHNLYPELSIGENVRFFATLFGLSKHEAEERMQGLLAATDLLRFIDRPAGKLSGGMKQKLGLCCSLIHDPDLLILDEPTTGVDPLSRRNFWELIEKVRADRPNLTLLVATAYMDEAAQFEHCLMLDNGKIIADGNTTELAQVTETGKLDDAFTHFQQSQGQAYQPLTIPPRKDEGQPIAIKAQDLTMKFGDFVAVNKVSFEIGKGEIFGFLGSNGCGKTTTMKMLTGLLAASEGEAWLLGNAVDAKDLATRKRVGFMSQSFSLYGELSVRQNLELHARLFDINGEQAKQRSQALIKRFHLEHYAEEQAGSLPLGLRQRLSLAVSIIHDPEVLILDEPTSGVDPAARDDFWRLLIELSRDQGVTIFLSTHFMNEAERCDRISLMHAGRVLAVGTPDALQQQYNGETLEEAFVTCLEQAQGETHEEDVSLVSESAVHVPRTSFSLTRMWATAMRETKELLRDKVRLAFALLGAVLMMVVLGLGISLDVEDLKFAVFDQDNSAQSRAYLEAYRGSRYFLEQEPITSFQNMQDRLQRAELKLAIEIPAGFGRDIFAGRSPEVAVWIDGGMPFGAETARGYVNALHEQSIQRYLEESSLPAGITDTPIKVETRFRYNQDVVSVNAMGPGVMALILVFIPTMLTALGVVREKELGSITNFYATPLTRLEFLLGKQAPYFVVSIINFILLIMINIWAFDVPLKGSLAALLVGGVLYVLATTSFGLLLSTVTKTQIAAILGSMILTTLPTIQFSGLIIPRSSLDGGSALLGTLFPAGYFLDITVGTFTKALGFAELLPKYLVLLAFYLSFTGLSLLLLKKQEA